MDQKVQDHNKAAGNLHVFLDWFRKKNIHYFEEFTQLMPNHQNDHLRGLLYSGLVSIVALGTWSRTEGFWPFTSTWNSHLPKSLVGHTMKLMWHVIINMAFPLNATGQRMCFLTLWMHSLSHRTEGQTRVHWRCDPYRASPSESPFLHLHLSTTSPICHSTETLPLTAPKHWGQFVWINPRIPSSTVFWVNTAKCSFEMKQAYSVYVISSYQIGGNHYNLKKK